VKIDAGMHSKTDLALLADVHAGPREPAREALRALYERHAESILTFLCRLESDVNLAEDILQETFLVAARNAGRFRSGSARPWLLSIAASRLRSARRARRRRREREEAVTRSELEEGASGARPDEELERALSTLPATERAVLDLRFHAGLGFREAAEVLGVSLRTAKSWSASGLRRLRKALGVEEEGR